MKNSKPIIIISIILILVIVFFIIDHCVGKMFEGLHP